VEFTRIWTDVGRHTKGNLNSDVDSQDALLRVAQVKGWLWELLGHSDPYGHALLKPVVGRSSVKKTQEQLSMQVYVRSALKLLYQMVLLGFYSHSDESPSATSWLNKCRKEKYSNILMKSGGRGISPVFLLLIHVLDKSQGNNIPGFYQHSDFIGVVSEAKSIICDIISIFCDIVLDHRITEFLLSYKRCYNQLPNAQSALASHKNDFSSAIASQERALTKPEVAGAVLTKLLISWKSFCPLMLPGVAELLIDLTKYDDSALVDKGLTALIRIHSQYDEMLRILCDGKLILLVSPEDVRVSHTVHEAVVMLSTICESNLLESESSSALVKQILEQLCGLCRGEDAYDSVKQGILRNAGVHLELMRILRAHMHAGNYHLIQELHSLFALVFKALQAFVADNEENERAVCQIDVLGFLLQGFVLQLQGMGVMNTLAMILSDNVEAIESHGSLIIRKVMGVLNASPPSLCTLHCLDVLQQVVECKGHLMPQSQDTILSALVDDEGVMMTMLGELKEGETEFKWERLEGTLKHCRVPSNRDGALSDVVEGKDDGADESLFHLDLGFNGKRFDSFDASELHQLSSAPNGGPVVLDSESIDSSSDSFRAWCHLRTVEMLALCCEGRNVSLQVRYLVCLQYTISEYAMVSASSQSFLPVVDLNFI
jgi:hypothetical protein